MQGWEISWVGPLAAVLSRPCLRQQTHVLSAIPSLLPT